MLAPTVLLSSLTLHDTVTVFTPIAAPWCRHLWPFSFGLTGSWKLSGEECSSIGEPCDSGKCCLFSRESPSKSAYITNLVKQPLRAPLELGTQMLLHTNRMPAGPSDEQHPAASVGVTLRCQPRSKAGQVLSGRQWAAAMILTSLCSHISG